MNPLHERLTWLLGALGVALATYMRRIAMPPQPVLLGHTLWVPRLPLPLLPPLSADIVQLFWARTGRAVRRVVALYQAWQAGTLPPPRPRAPRPAPTPAAPSAEPAPDRPRLPRGFAWLPRHAAEAGPIAGSLEHILQEPELHRFATEVPRAGRPLCHALGLVPPPALRLPPRPRRPRKPRPPRPGRPLPLTHPDLGLAPNIIRAVRYYRKRYGRD